MSLLLEALKKAELAKQNLTGSAPPTEAEGSGEIRFEEPAEPLIQGDAVAAFTAPEPFAPIEPVRPPAPEPVAAAPRTSRPAPPPEPEEAPPAPDPQRAAARQLFDVKEVDYNPKRPFYITLGVLGLAAVGYGAYLWWQLRPPATVNTAAIQNAPKSAPIARLPPPPDTPQSQDAPPVAGAQQTAAPDAAPPAAGAKASAASQPAAAPQSAASAPAATIAKPAPVATAPSPAPSAPSTFLKQAQSAGSAVPGSAPPAATAVAPRPVPPRSARLPIKVTPPSFKADEVLERAYAAFQRGELEHAKTDYQQVLARETNNRDALLGLAAIDVRTRDFETAELRYLKLLELDPRDAHAHAALISLQGNVDPVQSESRVKNLIAAQPDATHLYFTLGNQYAAQLRWAEAQDAYFKAYSAEPDNADFAFNLAVSLDHLRQRKLALEYYRKALSLAGTRRVGFDHSQAETRARELAR